MVCRTVAFVGAAVVVFGLQDGIALVWAFVVSLGTLVFPAVAVVVAVLAFASISYTFCSRRLRRRLSLPVSWAMLVGGFYGPIMVGLDGVRSQLMDCVSASGAALLCADVTVQFQTACPSAWSVS